MTRRGGSSGRHNRVEKSVQEGLSGYFLTGMTLEEVNYRVNPRFDPDAPLPNPLEHMSISTEHWRGEGKDKNRLSSVMRLELFKGLRSAPFRLSVRIRADYLVQGELPLEVDEFLKFNAPTHIYIFMRELVFNITSRGPTPTLILPLLNFEKLFS